MRERDTVYYSIDEILSDKTLTDEERREIMSKGKTTVQISKTEKKTVWVRTNGPRNEYTSNRSSSGNTTNGQYSTK